MTISAVILRVFKPIALAALLGGCSIATVCGQAVPYARTFPKSKEQVESTLRDIQAYAGQKLPVVDGFVALGDQPLSRYERAFYQFSINVLPEAPGTTIVRVTAKITAWYADRDPSKSGYQVLASNGRLELDLLDRLSEKFGGKPLIGIPRSSVQAPIPKLDLSGSATSLLTSGKSTSVAAEAPANSNGDEIAALRVRREAEEKRQQQLSKELQSLQEIQHNQVHPRNLIVVKKSGTPILAKAADGSRVLFMAAADDEFEFLDTEAEWIHVQISGASRGYIRRSGVELPEAMAKLPNVSPSAEKREIFRMSREQTGTFPGDWESLRGKTVKIYTVQPISADSKETRATAKLEFAATLFRKSSRASTPSADSVEGIVIIFDSADGGLIASTISSAQEFASGSLSREAFWKKCYADPPDAFQF